MHVACSYEAAKTFLLGMMKGLVVTSMNQQR